MEVLSKDSDYFGMYRPITDYGDFKTNCDSKIMGLYITLLINAGFIIAYGGPKKMINSFRGQFSMIAHQMKAQRHDMKKMQKYKKDQAQCGVSKIYYDPQNLIQFRI